MRRPVARDPAAKVAAEIAPAAEAAVEAAVVDVLAEAVAVVGPAVEAEADVADGPAAPDCRPNRWPPATSICPARKID